MSSEESNKKMAWKVGPFGGLECGGTNFDDGVHSAVKQLVIMYDKGIKSIQIEYDDNGSSSWSEHGKAYKSLFDKENTVKLDYPDEFLTSVYGCYNTSWQPGFNISSLTFKSNKKSYGPYGWGGGKQFSIEVPGSKIVGFHGGTCAFASLRAIGAHLKPIDHYQNDKCHPSKPLDHVSSSMNILQNDKCHLKPTVRDPSKLLLPPAEYPSHTKVISEDNDKANKQISCTISGNQVSGSEGNHNGTFAVANKYKYITYYYYLGNSNAM